LWKRATPSILACFGGAMILALVALSYPDPSVSNILDTKMVVADDLSKDLASAARSGLDRAVTENEKRVFAEIERQANRGLDPSVTHLPGRVRNNLLRAQATGNDLYFELAEKDMDNQWNGIVKPNLPGDADYSYVLEIDPGHGRNTNKLKDISGKIVGVDINPDNIAFLQNRFVGNSNLSFYQTGGVTIPKEIESGVSFVYCFDAMVHFDKEVINAYLLEIARLMRPGATGFIHHSQTPECPKRLKNGFCSKPDIIGHDHSNPHQRNAYSKEEFAKIAKEAGLTIIKQIDMVWDQKYGATDAISTFQKAL
jgi:SAM-dependent methyltransferase